MSEYDVIHEKECHRFVITENALEAVIEYKLDGNRVDFTRTFVPEGLRGKGLAGKLVRVALHWAKSEKLQISSSCWYVQKFL